MLKQISKIAAALIFGSSFIGVAMASGAHYGLPTKALAASSATNVKGSFGTVVLYNYTSYDYTAYTTFQPSGKQLPSYYVGTYRSGMDIITFDIDYPDTQVCLDIVRNIDRMEVYKDCSSNGNLNIGPYLLNNKPVVKVELK